MEHEWYRRTLLANPLTNNPEFETHRVSCEACRAFTGQLKRFEQRLTQALKIKC
jgi:hypothetical protein